MSRRLMIDALRCRAASKIEYALGLALIAVLAIVSVTETGTETSRIYCVAATAINKAMGGPGYGCNMTPGEGSEEPGGESPAPEFAAVDDGVFPGEVGSLILFSFADLMRNDIDSSGSMTIVEVSDPFGGKVKLGTNEVRFYPDQSGATTAFFTYKIRNSDGLEDTARVSMTLLSETVDIVAGGASLARSSNGSVWKETVDPNEFEKNRSSMIQGIERVGGAWIGVGLGGDVLATQDGLVWEQIGQVGSSYHLTAIGRGAAGLLAGSDGREIWRSADGGATWAPVAMPEHNPGSFRKFLTSPDGETVMAVSGVSAILMSHDGGATWSSTVLPSSGRPALTGTVVPGGFVVAVNATYPEFYATTDGGATWSPTVSTELTVNVGRVEELVWTGSRFVAVFHKDNVSPYMSFIRTSPDLVTWSAPVYQTPPNAHLFDLAIAGGRIVAVGGASATDGVGTDGLIVVSEDGGTSWASFRMPRAQSLMAVAGSD